MTSFDIFASQGRHTDSLDVLGYYLSDLFTYLFIISLPNLASTDMGAHLKTEYLNVQKYETTFCIYKTTPENITNLSSELL